MKIVVILPTYNERENIITVLEGLRRSQAKVRHGFEYLIVDDMSPDGTAAAVRSYARKHRDISVIEGRKEGLGKALLRGMLTAVRDHGAEIVLQLDADSSHDPSVLPAMIREIEKGADFVVGSRYIPGGSIPSNWGIHRKIFSIVGNALVRFGLGYPHVHDWTGGFRAYKRKFVDSQSPGMAKYRGYVFQIAFLHKAVMSGAKVREVPINFTDRRYGRSKIAPSEYIRNVIEYVLSERLRSIWTSPFGKFLVVGAIGFVINAVVLVLLHDLAHWDATLSNITGAAGAVFSNFNLNNRWTFRENRISGIAQYGAKLVQFYVTSAFGVLAIQTGTIGAGVRLFGDRYYFLFFLIGTSLLLIWNYTVYSRFIWKKSHHE
ncbi:hypothetical protein A2Z33_02855 [Candidatus Gottesmanbacteria bacterium RBG_16_52_11]|uniref:Glycosyltransferase 2-like domain-containing protein n=1 Tax=Candidatus Gottesmanbacteria bacterium RBG_16_52_11 TaxID=1798374 RepID=A0A1F5YMP2_9BACT|nr:MAG: hypothetical protein A2Z33_02855 [Candidatus Gottesmanbacteria bacterium RBG_16_52_11]